MTATANQRPKRGSAEMGEVGCDTGEMAQVWRGASGEIFEGNNGCGFVSGVMSECDDVRADTNATLNYPMKIISVLAGVVWSASVVSADEARIVPQPRLKLDPVTRAAVTEQSAKVAEAARAATGATEGGDASPILLGKYVVREHGKGAREAPKQETFEGRFTPWKGGRLWAGKLGGTNAEVGFWPYLEFTKVAGTAMREGGPRLNVDFLRVKW